jgi:hypothetical protein
MEAQLFFVKLFGPKSLNMQPEGDNAIFFLCRKKGRQANFCQSPQNAKPQVLGLILQLQIRTFLSCDRTLY